MNLEVLTKEDLQAFRVQLLGDLEQLFAHQAKASTKEWMKSSEVKKVLKISTNTLQSLRIQGKLHPAKVGGIYFYSWEEINVLLSSHKKMQA